MKEIVDEDVISKILPTGSQPGKLYGLCKVHKANYRLRPVISMSNTSEYELAKYLDTFIQPNIPSSYITNSTDQFLDNLKHYDFSEIQYVIKCGFSLHITLCDGKCNWYEHKNHIK